jgi:hypothetical protein
MSADRPDGPDRPERRAVLDRLRRPEYTGENRCTPCTVVNTALAALLAAGAGGLAAAATPAGTGPVPAPVPGLAAGGLVLAAGLASIHLRGYLVPGTPRLTKRYFPDRVLAWFDRAPDSGPGTAPATPTTPTTAPEAGGPAAEPAGVAAAGEDGGDGGDGSDDHAPDPGDPDLVDPEALLARAGAVEPCADRDDLRLTPDFRADLRAAVDDLRDAPDRREDRLAALFDREVTLTTAASGARVATDPTADGSGRLDSWVSDGALIADLAAAAALDDRIDWASVPVAQRPAILQPLRSFLDDCPVCGGRVRTTEDTVESCCRAWDVIAVRCRDCGEHYLEVDPDRLDGAA